jgi:hypothetical protein
VQLVAFLEKLGELRSLTPLAASMARQLDKAYSLDAAKNCEIRCAWYKVRHEESWPAGSHDKYQQQQQQCVRQLSHNTDRAAFNSSSK